MKMISKSSFPKGFNDSMYIYGAFLAGFFSLILKSILNTFYYDPYFFGLVIFSPITEEFLKTILLYFVLYVASVKSNFFFSNHLYYSLGIFTGIGFGIFESILAYNLLDNPHLLTARIFATFIHILTTFIDGIGLVKYLKTQKTRWIITLLLGIIIHSYWNYWVSFAP